MQEAQTQPEEQSPEQAMESARAGYDSTTRAPAPVEVEPSEQLPADEVLDEPDQSAVAPEQALAEQLAVLKAQVQEMAGSGVEVRKLHGEIGNINRTLKQLQTPKRDEPASDELADAWKAAESVANDYPEIAGPLVKAMKAMQKAVPAPAPLELAPEYKFPTSIETPAPAPVVDPEVVRQEVAIKAIDEVHPDRHAVKASPEFKAWFAAKTPEYQKTINSTWNPAVLSQCFSDFKTTQLTRKRKQERLDAAIAPQGVSQSAQSTTLPDDAGFSIGYNKAGRR